MNRHDGPLTCKSERIREVGCAMRGSGSSSPARVIPRGFVCVLPLLSTCVVFMVQPAVAATWPVSTSGLSATLAFHQSYTAGIESYVHSGIDIPASAGMQISSPLAGTVRFTGTVPSGDSRIGGSSSARTMKAVSIELADGRAISLMPFASIAVREGQSVIEGQALGTLAAGGDVSTSATHLHMGYKQGPSYLDPMLLFGTASSASHDSGISGMGGARATNAGTSAAEGASRIVDGESTAVVQTQPDAASAADDVPAANSESFGVIETGDYELSAGKVRSQSSVVPVADALGQLGSACAGQFTGLLEALSGLSNMTGIGLPALVVGTCALAPCSLFALALFCARRFVSQRCDILKSKGARLSLPFGGGSMRKLFPASGAAFMSRSRIAQRR